MTRLTVEQVVRLRKDPFIRGILSDDVFGTKAVRLDYALCAYSSEDQFLVDEEESEENSIESSDLTLRPLSRYFDYQQDLIDQILALHSCASDSRRVALVALPTGAGKTRTMVGAILSLHRENSLRKMLWLAPTKELLNQAFQTTVDVWNSSGCQMPLRLVRCDMLGGFPEVDGSSLLFSTPQMLNTRAEGLRNSGWLQDVSLQVFDEAHHANAPTFRRSVELVLKESNCLTIGLSATPGRVSEDETEELVSLFRQRLITSPLLGARPVESLREIGILASLEFHRIEVPGTKGWPGRIVERRGDKQRSRRDLELDAQRFAAIISTVSRLGSDGKVLVFAGSVQHAHALAAVLRGLGVAAAAVSGYTNPAKRTDLLRQFESGKLSVLLNKSLLATGYDCPTIKHVVLSVPIYSPILFEQIVGRVSRGPKVGGNAVGHVWQVDDNLSINGCPASYYRFKDYDWIRQKA